jgi:hypothetical protein
MASIVPTSRMVVIVVVVMCFVAACQSHSSDAYEKENAESVLELIFHDGGFCLDVHLVVHKPCQNVKVYGTRILASDMSKVVDISPQSKNATKVV